MIFQNSGSRDIPTQPAKPIKPLEDVLKNERSDIESGEPHNETQTGKNEKVYASGLQQKSQTLYNI